MKPKTIAILVLVISFLVILLQNIEVVTLQILFWKVEMSRIIFIPGVTLLGFGVGYLVGRAAGKRKIANRKKVGVYE